MPAAEPPFIRLLKNYKVNEKTGCWEWSLSTYDNGYGQIKAFGKEVLVHRFSYELHKGPIPDGLEILHSCDNKICINPDHLSVGTHQKNMEEAKERKRMRSGKDHHFYGSDHKRGAKSTQAKQVMVKGKIYGSINEAEKILDLGSGTVNYWLKNKKNQARLVTREEYKNAQ